MASYLAAIEQAEIQNLASRAGNRVSGAIYNASMQTDINFSYLMEKAAAESSFDIKAKATTSSASGLFQFIEKTWMQMVKKYGHKHGMGHYADKIGPDGQVSDSKTKADILALRDNPEKAALMAAELASENKAILEKTTSREVGPVELYFAHFMGPSGASRFLNTLDQNPDIPAADVFKTEARSNRNVFYEKNTGKKRTMEEVYQFFKKKFNGGKPSNSDKDTLVAEKDTNPEQSGNPSLNTYQKAFKPYRMEYDPVVRDFLLGSFTDIVFDNDSKIYQSFSSLLQAQSYK